MACSRRTRSCAVKSSHSGRGCNRSLKRERSRAGRAGAHELGQAAQTGLRHRHRTLPELRRSLKIIAAIEDPPVIVKILTHLGLPTRAPPRAPARESIYSRQSEEPKTVCQRKPTAPLALSSREQRHKEPFAHLPTALRPSRPVQQWVFHQAEKELTTLPVLRYGSGHRKGR